MISRTVCCDFPLPPPHSLTHSLSQSVTHSLTLPLSLFPFLPSSLPLFLPLFLSPSILPPSLLPFLSRCYLQLWTSVRLDRHLAPLKGRPSTISTRTRRTNIGGRAPDVSRNERDGQCPPNRIGSFYPSSLPAPRQPPGQALFRGRAGQPMVHSSSGADRLWRPAELRLTVWRRRRGTPTGRSG